LWALQSKEGDDMSVVCIPCAEKELARLRDLHQQAVEERDDAMADETENAIGELARLAWPCIEDGCDDHVSLGEIASRKAAR
jgi:hypothetical protein